MAAIKNIMKKFNMTAQEAMETLDISKADFKMYMSLLSENAVKSLSLDRGV